MKFTPPVSTRLPLKKRLPTKKKSKVRFGRSTYRLFRKDFTEEEKAKIWYNAEDYQRIQSSIQMDLREAVATHRRMMKCPDMPPPAHEINVRGLEHHLHGPINVKRQRRAHFVRYFLHTKNYMRVTNPHELRALAVSMSSEDQHRAQRIASYDALEAYKVHKEARMFFHQATPEAASMEEFQEFDNVPKATIGVARCDRAVVAPLA